MRSAVHVVGCQPYLVIIRVYSVFSTSLILLDVNYLVYRSLVQLSRGLCLEKKR